MAPQPEAGALKVAAVVTFYMVSALVVSCNSQFHRSVLADLFLDDLRVRWSSLPASHVIPSYTFLGHSNKAVLNNSPELPLLFLLLQLLIAVVLLHVSALFTKRIEIPKFEAGVAKSLIPVVSVNIIGLVFNTLCLKDVEASFFQV